jgi:hypothetical protein
MQEKMLKKKEEAEKKKVEDAEFARLEELLKTDPKAVTTKQKMAIKMRKKGGIQEFKP